MALRSPSAALTYAKTFIGDRYPVGYCLKWVRTLYNVPAKYPDAATAWRNTKYRHGGTPPKGVPVWWTGGSQGYGHVAISDGNGYVISTDAPNRGYIGRVSIAWINRWWGLTYRGWSEDINGYRVYRYSSTTLPSVSYSKVRSAAKSEGYGGTSVLLVQKALKKKYPGFDYSSGPGWFGDRTRYYYRKWQLALGYSGSDADGIPGLTSLRKLGSSTGLFKVVS